MGGSNKLKDWNHLSHCDWGWGNPKEEGIIQALEKSNTYWVRQAGKQLTRLTARLAKTEQSLGSHHPG
ncbi:Myotubularin-Related Protein 3 [Manis pentadactyla]|nr:Myotubularin-Related Protein 3 [Manis pentadactyla]